MNGHSKGCPFISRYVHIAIRVWDRNQTEIGEETAPITIFTLAELRSREIFRSSTKKRETVCFWLRTRAMRCDAMQFNYELFNTRFYEAPIPDCGNLRVYFLPGCNTIFYNYRHAFAMKVYACSRIMQLARNSLCVRA